jgi:photosystem II stability/assembly factor-like uncharacterized protein
MVVQVEKLTALEWRHIGPHRGGRVVAVAGDPRDPMTFYFGACAGGVWKSTDAGTYWQNVSDGFFNTAAVGAIAVAPSDPNVIYAGTGESCIRGDVSHGDGVYRSTDAGQTWTHCGLADTRHIARIRVHPHDPDTVYVAALGHAFGPNQERGVFRSRDGGRSWEKVLFRDEKTGAIDLSIDPNNPRVLYASLWEAIRRPWEMVSGGPGSSIYKSTDGGDTWTELTDNPGLPKGLKGRIGVALSPAKPSRVWALIEAENKGGLYRTDDGGATWELISEDREIQQRPWYYMHVFADPQDADTCYILNLRMWKSTDGGKSFTPVTTPHGDNHDLWIDPADPQRMIEGNDGGACVSFNGGATWSTIYNQPTACFYHVATDTRFPYHVYGTQQDNSAIGVPSHSVTGAIPWAECYYVGHSESGHIQVRPDNPNVVFSGAIGSSPGGGGSLLRWDGATGQTQIITVWPEAAGGLGAGAQKYRFQWTYPILISPHDPNTLYVAGNQLFKSTDEGISWEVLSPDLTRNDPSKLGPSGGPITKDTTGAEHYCTIFAFTESPHEQGLFWVGTDDGLVQISRDAGKTWENVTPPDLPEWTTINVVEVSPHDPATAYIASWRYKLHDNSPYLYKTNDYGRTWTRITDGIAEDDFTRIIREDPVRRGLLYAGTETGLYVSFDDGASWQRFMNNLPVVPVYDLQVKGDDLIAATHGRSFWVLDDLTALRALTDDVLDTPVHLFPPRDTVRTRPLPGAGRQTALGQKNYQMGLGSAFTFIDQKTPDGEPKRILLDAGENPPNGVVVHYWLKERPEGELKLEFLDRDGNLVKSFTSKPDEKPEDAQPQEIEPGEEGDEGPEPDATPQPSAEEKRAPKEAGLNRFVWNMRAADAEKVEGDATTEQSLTGPVVAPGEYQVRLTVNGQTSTERARIVKDPRVKANQEDLEAQYELLVQIRDKLSETQRAINQIRALKSQVAAWIGDANGAKPRPGLPKPVLDAGKALRDSLTAVEEELIQPKAKGQLDSIQFPVKLNSKIAALTSVVASADSVPPKQTYEVLEHLSGQVDEQLRRLRNVIDTDADAFNRAVQEAALPAVAADVATVTA